MLQLLFVRVEVTDFTFIDCFSKQVTCVLIKRQSSVSYQASFTGMSYATFQALQVICACPNSLVLYSQDAGRKLVKCGSSYVKFLMVKNEIKTIILKPNIFALRVWLNKKIISTKLKVSIKF